MFTVTRSLNYNLCQIFGCLSNMRYCRSNNLSAGEIYTIIHLFCENRFLWSISQWWWGHAMTSQFPWFWTNTKINTNTYRGFIKSTSETFHSCTQKFSPRIKIWIYWSKSNSWIIFFIYILIKTEKLTGPNQVILVLERSPLWELRNKWEFFISRLSFDNRYYYALL